MRRTNLSQKEKVVFMRSVIIIATALLHTTLATAQTNDSSEDAALLAAERALLEGLSHKGPSAFDAPAAQNSEALQAHLKPATYQAPVIKHEQTQDESPVRVEKASVPVVQSSTANRAAQAPVADRADTVSLPAAPPPVVPNPNAALKRELEASHKRIADLERTLEEVRGQLAMAETELSRLATISEARTRASLGRAALPPAPIQPSGVAAPVVATGRIDSPAIEPTPASSADLTIATVDVEKAELRLGPGKNHSSLMTVAKGSRLAVEARQGEWLRVFAPNGQRAWVQSKLVTFGSKGGVKSVSTTVRVHGYSSSLEDEAFKRVQSLTAG
ncbi:MAG: Bacterial domain [Pseudomonadota bacterium]|jgi:hypothetical protein